MRRLLAHVACVVCALLATAGRGRACEPPVMEPFSARSPDGNVTVRVVPLYQKEDAAISVTRGGPLWRAPIADNPYGLGAAVSNRGEVALFRGWDPSTRGRPNLVVYDATGAVKLERRLEELLLGAEMADAQGAACGKYWVGAAPPPRLDGDVLKLTLWNGVALELRLADGSQWRGGAKVEVPSDDRRLREYAAGARPSVVRPAFYRPKGIECTFGDGRIYCLDETNRSWSRKVAAGALLQGLQALLAASGSGGAVEPLRVCFEDEAKYCYDLVVEGKAAARWHAIAGLKR